MALSRNVHVHSDHVTDRKEGGSKLSMQEYHVNDKREAIFSVGFKQDVTVQLRCLHRTWAQMSYIFRL